MISSKTYEILELLNNIPKGTGSRKLKENILKQNMEYLKEVMDIAFNPYRVFNISKIPKKSIEVHKSIPQSLENLIDILEATKGGTNLNKDLVRAFIDSQPVEYQQCIEQIVLKNIKIGVEITTLNKCGYNIPEFNLLLADPNKNNSLEGHTFPCYAQTKLDGVRVVRFPDGTFLGRNGRPVPNENIKNHIEYNDNFVLDGEFYSFKRKFNEIIGVFSSDNAPIPEDVVFVVFNAIHIDDWFKEQPTFNNYTEEKEFIDKTCHKEGSKNLMPMPTKLVFSVEECQKFFNGCLDMGLEGAMIRNVNSCYHWKRVKVKDGILTKMKPSDHADCKIVSSYEGLGRNAGKLGGFTVDYKGKLVDVGGGFSDTLREQFWKSKDSMVGKWCRVKYTQITEDGSLRFPIWDNLIDSRD